MSNPEVHICHDCGYQWKHGEHGGHSCAHILKQRNEQLHTEKATLLAAIDTYRFCHIQLKNTVEFADNGEASYVADEVLMSKFDAANDFALKVINGPFFNQPENLFFNPIVGCVEHEYERDGQQEQRIWNGICNSMTKATRTRYPITSDLVLTLKLDEEDKKRIQSIVDNDRDVAGGLYSREMLDLLTTGQIHHSTEGGKS